MTCMMFTKSGKEEKPKYQSLYKKKKYRIAERANHWLSVGKLTLFETQKQTGL